MLLHLLLRLVLFDFITQYITFSLYSPHNKFNAIYFIF